MSVNGSPYTGTPASVASNLNASNPNCTVKSQGLSCTASAPAIAGNDVFSVKAYDAAQTSSTPATPAGNLLSGASVTVNVLANQVTTVTTPLTLNGVVDHVDVTTGVPQVNAGAAAQIAVSVNARDKQNNIIISGTYQDANGNPLTIHLTDSDASGLTALSTSTLTGPTAVTLNYTGGNPASATLAISIGATVTGGTIAGTLTPAAFAVQIPAPTLTALSNNNWVTSDGPSSFTMTLTGTNLAGATVNVGGTGVTVSSVTVVNTTTVTATFTVAANAVTAMRTVTVTTLGGTTPALNLNVVPGLVVTDGTDTASVGAVNGLGNGNPDDLRWSLLNGFAGMLVVFNCGSPCTITLGGPLPPITTDVTIDGGTFGQTIIDGAGAYRPFFAESGNILLENLQIQNGFAAGGNGGNDGGGGGLRGRRRFVRRIRKRHARERLLPELHRRWRSRRW